MWVQLWTVKQWVRERETETGGEAKRVVEMQWVHDFYWIRFILILFVSCVRCSVIMLRVSHFFSLTFHLCLFSLCCRLTKVHGNSYTQWYRRGGVCVLVRVRTHACVIFFSFLICSSQQILLEYRHRGKNKMRLLRENGNNLSTIRKLKQWKASLYWSQFAGSRCVCVCFF